MCDNALNWSTHSIKKVIYSHTFSVTGIGH